MAEARSLADQALEMTLPFGRIQRATYPRLQLAEILSVQGDLERAITLVSEADEIAHRSGDLQAQMWGARIRAGFVAFVGATDEIVTAMDSLLTRCRLQHSYVGWTLVSLGTVELSRDDVGRAEASVREALAERDEWGEYWVQVPGRLLLGMVLTERERWSEAAEVFQETASLASSAPHPYLMARAFHEWGRMLARQGNAEAARERLQEGRAIYEKLGARLYLKQIEADLAAIG
jgi:ATP/maltotriose-dependent transcriptional regulator MalT